MNAAAPVCPRCDGTRFFRVLRMRDANGRGPEVQLEWRERPVLVEAPHGAIGHFETLICRRCAYTAWFARDWGAASLRQPTSPAPCRGCGAATPHTRLPAIEHSYSMFEHARITNGMLGREGYLHLSICNACELVSWSGSDYAHLDRPRFVRYRLVRDEAKPCLACRGVDAIVDEAVLEAEDVKAPVVVREDGILARWFGHRSPVGYFALRLCKPCGAVEWYARGIDKLTHDPTTGVLAVGDEQQPQSMGGPYR